MTGIQHTPTIITIEPVAGELRPHLNEYGVETVRVYDGKQWIDFAQPSYQDLILENQRLREEIADLKDTILEMAEQQNYGSGE